MATSYVKKLRVAPNGALISKGEKLVLFVLSDYYHDELGYAWASLSHLAQESLHTRSGVIKTLQALEQKGVLAILRSEDAATKRVTNRYQFPALEVSDSRTPLVNSVDQSSQLRRPGLVNSVDHIFPLDLSSDLSKDSGGGPAPTTATGLPDGKDKGRAVKSAEVSLAYTTAYRQRYGVEPLRNARMNALLCQLVDRLGADEAPSVASFYLSVDASLYVNAWHPLNLLVRDCETLRTQWKCGPSRVKPFGPKAMQPAPRIEAQGEPCPPEVAAKLSRLLGGQAFSFGADQSGAA
jgi:hypothetical protein